METESERLSRQLNLTGNICVIVWGIAVLVAIANFIKFAF